MTRDGTAAIDEGAVIELMPLGQGAGLESPADQVVGRALTALDAAGIEWLLLRGTLDGSAGDIDLLVDPAALERLGGTLRLAGFARLPSIGYGSHRFWLTWDPSRGLWHKLDVVSELAYGRGGAIRTPVGPGVLGRRERQANYWTPSDDDAFWSLWLHALLDRPRLDDEQLAVLAALARRAQSDGELGTWLDRLAGHGFATRAIAATRSGRRGDLRRLARRLVAAAWLADAPRVGWRYVRARAGRTVAKILMGSRRPGITAALLGPDGAGKSTLAASLTGAFPIPTRTLYLGLYGAGSNTPPGLGLPIRACACCVPEWSPPGTSRTDGSSFSIVIRSTALPAAHMDAVVDCAGRC